MLVRMCHPAFPTCPLQVGTKDWILAALWDYGKSTSPDVCLGLYRSCSPRRTMSWFPLRETLGSALIQRRFLPLSDRFSEEFMLLSTPPSRVPSRMLDDDLETDPEKEVEEEQQEEFESPGPDSEDLGDPCIYVDEELPDGPEVICL